MAYNFLAVEYIFSLIGSSFSNQFTTIYPHLHFLQFPGHVSPSPLSSIFTFPHLLSITYFVHRLIPPYVLGIFLLDLQGRRTSIVRAKVRRRSAQTKLARKSYRKYSNEFLIFYRFSCYCRGSFSFYHESFCLCRSLSILNPLRSLPPSATTLAVECLRLACRGRQTFLKNLPAYFIDFHQIISNNYCRIFCAFVNRRGTNAKLGLG